MLWYNKNIELQQNFKKIYNWYWKFFKNVATKKSCSRRWNYSFQNIGFIKIYIFSSSFKFLMKLLWLYSGCKGNFYGTPTIQKLSTKLSAVLFQMEIQRMWTYLAKFLAYNGLKLKYIYNQKSHDWKLIPMHFNNNPFGKTLFFIQILFSKLLYSISFYANILQSWKKDFSHIS